MSFCFELEGSPVSAELSCGPRSYVSVACLNRLGLSFSGECADLAVSVKIGDSWPTCVMSLLVSGEHQEFDLVLGGDWKGLMKELCSATGVIFPVALQRSIVHGPIPAFEVREQTSRRSASPPTGCRSSGGGDGGGHECVEPAEPSPNIDLPNCSLHIDNLNTENVQFKSLICDPSSSFFVLGGSSSAVVEALRLHGVLYEGLSGDARRAALVHHLFYGHCHRRATTDCQAVAQMSTSMVSLATSLSEEVLALFRRSKLLSGIFQDLCLLLGF